MCSTNSTWCFTKNALPSCTQRIILKQPKNMQSVFAIIPSAGAFVSTSSRPSRRTLCGRSFPPEASPLASRRSRLQAAAIQCRMGFHIWKSENERVSMKAHVFLLPLGGFLHVGYTSVWWRAKDGWSGRRGHKAYKMRFCITQVHRCA